jgi:hypothetical protein
MYCFFLLDRLLRLFPQREKKLVKVIDHARILVQDPFEVDLIVDIQRVQQRRDLFLR